MWLVEGFASINIHERETTARECAVHSPSALPPALVVEEHDFAAGSRPMRNLLVEKSGRDCRRQA